MKYRKILLLISLTLMVMVSTLPLINANQSWSENVRLTNHAGKDYISILGGSLALDAEGKIHVVVYNGGQLYHIYDNDGFINETIITASAGTSADYDASPSVVFDSTGTMHVAYYASDGQDYEIYYTHNNSEGGFITPIKITDDNEEIQESFPKIDIDNTNKVHIVYQLSEFVPYDETTQQLKVILRYSHQISENVFSSPVNITHPTYSNVSATQDIAVDNNNIVHITFMVIKGENILVDPTDVVYTNNTGGNFSNYELIDKTYQDFTPSLTVGSNGIAHIVFRGNGSESPSGYTYHSIYYVNNSGGYFNNSLIEKVSTVSFAHFPKIAFSPNNTLNIVYYGWNETWSHNFTRLMYVNNITGSFQEESLIPEQDLDQAYSSLAVDSDGNVHIVYMYGDLAPGAASNIDIYYVTTSSYYPVGVGELPDPTLIFIIIGIVGGVIGITVFIVLVVKYRRIEREVWKPELGESDQDKENEKDD